MSDMSAMSAMSGRKQLEHNDLRHDGPERPELIAAVAAGDGLSVLAPLSIPSPLVREAARSATSA
jgi:hypothetical protein